MPLENKLGITDSFKLANEEEKLSKKKALEMFQTGYLDNLKAGSLDSLIKIHKHLFEDIYEFAGQIRTVNIAKGNFRFAPVMYLNEALKSIENMPQSTFDEIIEKNEIYDIFVKPDSRYKDYKLALLAKAIELNRTNRMMVLVDVDALEDIEVYTAAGFEKANGQNSIYATYKLC